MSPLRILSLLIYSTVYGQFHSGSFIQSEVPPPEEINELGWELKEEKLAPHEIDELFAKDVYKQVSRSPQPSWKAFQNHPVMYKTDHEVVDNDPIEQEIVDMVPRAKGFYEDSGIQLVTNKPHIQPISSETEISMSMSTLPDKTPPDMQPKHLELKTLPPPLSIESNEIPEEVKPTTRSPISFDYRRSEGTDPYKKIALESALDMTTIPKMHNDVQKLIEEVTVLKKLVYKLLNFHVRERKRNTRRRKPSRKMAGTSIYGSRPDRLTAAVPTEDFMDHFVHTFADKRDKKFASHYEIFK